MEVTCTRAEGEAEAVEVSVMPPARGSEAGPGARGRGVADIEKAVRRAMGEAIAQGIGELHASAPPQRSLPLRLHCALPAVRSERRRGQSEERPVPSARLKQRFRRAFFPPAGAVGAGTDSGVLGLKGRVHYTRLSPTDAPTDLFSGVYLGSFGPHGPELLQVRQHPGEGAPCRPYCLPRVRTTAELAALVPRPLAAVADRPT